MLVFIDESGDPGMKQRLNTSRFFIVTAALFNKDEDAEGCEALIKKLREELSLHPRFEFRFNSCNNRFRERFLTAVSRAEFHYHSLVLNKAALWGQGFHDKEALYRYATRLLFENARPRLERARIVIDRCGNREFRDQLARYLKSRINDGTGEFPAVRTIKMEASHSSNLLQLADMVCGAVARSFNLDKEDRWHFRKIIAGHELQVQVWP